jgi:hypothetical protein
MVKENIRDEGRNGEGENGQERITEKTCKAVKGKKAFKEKDKEVAYIIGGGTSVSQLLNNPHLYYALHDNVIFGCNKAVEHFDCDYFVFHDHSFGRDHQGLLKDFKGQAIYAPTTNNNNLKYEGVTYVRRNHAAVRFDFTTGIYTGNNCGVTALSIAIALGYKTIYLIGMDCRFDEAMTRTHFHEGYNKRHDEKSESSYDGFATFFENVGREIVKTRPDVKVYNASYISLIDIEEKYFKRVNIGDVLIGNSTDGKGYISEDICGSP